jgi:hypothetical protein
MNVCVRQLCGSLAVVGGTAGVFIGLLYGNVALLYVSPVVFLTGTVVSCLPIPPNQYIHTLPRTYPVR